MTNGNISGTGSRTGHPSDLPQAISRAVLAWYGGAARVLPWRAPPGAPPPDPYRVWLSEIMLQQTTVKAVIPYYLAFVARWPTIADLASAELNDVLAAWAGLGYYSRARNLHACARTVAAVHGGRFPADETALSALPGIGTYTAAAIAAIAYGRPATVVDGNVKRVVARLFAVEAPLPGAKAEIRRLATQLTPTERPGDFAQGMMDLGASVCSPRAPSCTECPLAHICAAHARGIAAALPARTPRPERPQRFGAAFVALRGDGAVLLRRRPPKGLLGGMLEVPSTEWTAGAENTPTPTPADPPTGPRAAHHHAPIAGKWRLLPGAVGHTFTHFHLQLSVYHADHIDARAALPPACEWYARARLDAAALPSVMRKVLAHAFAAARKHR